MPVSLSEVQARWAYSEITDGAQSHSYDGILWIGPLRQKRGDNVPFANLSEQDRYALALACAFVRPNLLIFATAVGQFQEVGLSRAQLAPVLVPWMVAADLPQGQIVRFDHYIALPPPADPADARNVVGNPADYRPAGDPLTLGRFFQHLILLDGYHRAASFWRAAPDQAVVRCFRPV
jgi:hypothetical protein